MSLPKPLQSQVDEDARIAEWRASEKQKAELAAAMSKNNNDEKPVVLRKDGTPMRKRGPKPKVKQEASGNGVPAVVVPPVEKSIVKKSKLARPLKQTDWQGSSIGTTAEHALDSNMFFLSSGFSSQFLEHLLVIIKREKAIRKRITQ